MGNDILYLFCMTCIGAQPGWFEDSFSFKFGLPGCAGSVPTVLHDATDTGTDCILGGGQGKMIPRDFKIQHEDSCSLNFRLPGNPTHEGKFPTHVPGNCMQQGLQEHRWETAFGSFFV